jgi:heavy metal sensor kinase
MIAPFKLRTKLALSYAILFAILLGIGGFAVYRLMAFRLKADADDNLVDHLAGLWGYIQFHDGKPTIAYDPNNPYLTYFLHEATRFYQVYDATSGSVLLESDDSAVMKLAIPTDKVRELVRTPGIDTVSYHGVPIRFRSAVFQADGHSYLLRVGVSIERDLADITELKKILLSMFPITILITGAGVYWMAGRSLRPLRNLQREANTITITQLNRRLRLRGAHDELDALARTFNEVFSRLDAGVQQMRNFAGYMAHELRTPMTVLRGETEVELMRLDLSPEWRAHLKSHLEEYDKLNQLINRFLLLAKAETGAIELHKQPVDLSGITRLVTDHLEAIAISKGVILQLEVEDSIQVTADRQWMERAILNLLDNAIKFSSKGAEIRLSVRREDSQVVLKMIDHGQGIAGEDLPHVFDYFYRAASSEGRQSAAGGLGLALTKWIIEGHGGTIRVDSKVGEGSIFTIVLPSATNPVIV